MKGQQSKVLFWIITLMGSVLACSVAAEEGLLINEIMASNGSIITDPQGEYDDWIEMANLTQQTLDLGGCYLSDDPNDPLKWQFPAGSSIEGNDYLLI